MADGTPRDADAKRIISEVLALRDAVLEFQHASTRLTGEQHARFRQLVEAIDALSYGPYFPLLAAMAAARLADASSAESVGS